MHSAAVMGCSIEEAWQLRIEGQAFITDEKYSTNYTLEVTSMDDLATSIAQGIAQGIDDYVERTGCDPTLDEIGSAMGTAAAHVLTILAGGTLLDSEIAEIRLPKHRRWFQSKSRRRQ